MTPFYIHKIEGNQAWLDGEEARHCTKVMRKKAGDTIIAIDGKGFMHVSRIKTMGKNALELEILESHENWGEKSQRVVLCISPLHKVDRLEWLIEKGVELGVTDFILYIGKHTVKTGFRLDRLERIMAAALKQSLRSRLPTIHQAPNFVEMLRMISTDLKLIAHAEMGQSFSEVNTEWQKLTSISLLVGPEGDFAAEELELAIEAGFACVELGKNRLRSETAAIHFLGIAKFLIGY